MSLANWVKNSWLERRDSDAAEIARLLGLADGRLGNVGSYDDYGLVSQGEADHCGKMAVRVRKEVEDWIRKNHAGKIV
jgi:hypothetical protein